MSEIIKQVLGYQVVRYIAGVEASAAIFVYCEDDYRMMLCFLNKPDPELINTFDPATKMGVAYFDGSGQYPHFIDLLRNEGPISMAFDTPPGVFFMFTGKAEGDVEVIGEGEIARTLEEIRRLLNL